MCLFQVNFVCPGILDKYSRFHKNYEQKILRSRMPGASKAEVELGMERAQEVDSPGDGVPIPDEQLSDLSKEFVIRRTADVLTNYLPPRREQPHEGSFGSLTCRRLCALRRPFYLAARGVRQGPQSDCPRLVS